MSCDREGNRRSGVALVMRHRLEWFIHLRAQGLSNGDEHPTNTLHGHGTLLRGRLQLGPASSVVTTAMVLSIISE